MLQEESQDRPLGPLAVHKDEGKARWWFGNLAVIKATAVDTGGQMSILEITEPPSEETPPHVHRKQDLGFWILDGEAAFEVGRRAIEVAPGDYVFVPRGTPLRWKAGDDGFRYLLIVIPGGIEDAVMELSEPASSRALPPPSEVEPDMERILAIAEAHGIERLI